MSTASSSRTTPPTCSAPSPRPNGWPTSPTSPAAPRAPARCASWPGSPACWPRCRWRRSPRPPAAPLPETLLPGLLREVGARRRRRRRVAALWAAAAAVVIAVGAGVLGSSLASDRQAPRTPVAAAAAPRRDLVAVVPSPVTASVAMVPMGWGTRLDLSCGYYTVPGTGSATPREYTLVVHSRTGRSQQVAAWLAPPGKRLSLTAASYGTRRTSPTSRRRPRAGWPCCGSRTSSVRPAQRSRPLGQRLRAGADGRDPGQ